jgi:holliday junction DNA helicase RuvA
MRHYLLGTIKHIQSHTYIVSQHGWVLVQYAGAQSDGAFFLFPYLDDNRKTISYFAFDTYEQYAAFEKLLKVNWIGPKTAFHIAYLPTKDLQDAIQQVDINFFKSVPGIGPKSAKKIILELKETIHADDVYKITGDTKVIKKILQTMKNLGYNTEKVKKLLLEYTDPITEDSMQEAIRWLVKKL